MAKSIKDRVLDQLFNYGRDDFYSVAELDRLAAREGFPDRHHIRWIVVYCGSYFLLTLERGWMGPYGAQSLVNAAMQELAPACAPGPGGIVIEYVNERSEEKIKPPVKLMRDYGVTAAALQYSLSGTNRAWDPATRLFTKVCAPMRRIRPREHKDVGTWLELLGGDRAHKLLDWVACVTRLEDACAALYLTGRGGSGKTLLACGLSRIWSTENMATPMSAVMSGYNEKLRDCPLVFADEEVPTDFRGKPRTADLRELVTAMSHKMTAKWEKDSSIKGAMRIIIAANNENLVQALFDESRDEMDSNTDRILHIKVTDRPVAYLRSLPHGTTHRWVKEDAIAEHALWLAKTRKVQPGGRLLVEGDIPDSAYNLAAQSGNKARLCAFVSEYIERHLGEAPAAVSSDAAPILVAREHDGRVTLWANVRSMASAWSSVMESVDPHPPKVGQLRDALIGVSTGEARRMRSGKQRAQYIELTMRKVIEWANDVGYDADKLVAKLESNAEIQERAA